jgi:hypothetical protein
MLQPLYGLRTSPRSYWIGKWTDSKADLDLVAEVEAKLLVYAKMAQKEAMILIYVRLSQLTDSIMF